MAIYFYSTIDQYGAFSNFSKHGFELDGQYWPTVEHYFQAQKFSDTAYKDRIRLAASPKLAKQYGRTRAIPLRQDWEMVKDEIMKKAAFRKFETHKNIRLLLLSTGDEEIIENAPNDYYWGCGADGSGKNKLGKTLMEIRSKLRENSLFSQ